MAPGCKPVYVMAILYLRRLLCSGFLLQVDVHKEVKCRYDWHQTGSMVVIAIYAKMYHYEKSSIKLNPVRLNVALVFPQQDNAEFKLDIELRGVSYCFID